jgi:nicotinamidase-related amidase
VTLPLPPHFEPQRIGEIWPVPYEERAAAAEEWARRHGIGPAAGDEQRVCLVCVDCQNTFCIPDFELFVAGRSGRSAVDDVARLCEFLYRNLDAITQVVVTLDTHRAMQVFHALFLVDGEGRRPPPFTLVSVEDVESGRWRFDPEAGPSLGIDADYGEEHLLHYARRLEESGKYELTVWPYHAMLGSVGHALVPALEEAIFFHTVARSAQARFEVKGSESLTEHYSMLGPEVTEGPDGRPLGARNRSLIDDLLGFDALLIAGQAKSHCVAWTVEDLLADVVSRDPALASRVYLLEDCTSPVVVPGAVDYTDAADAAFGRFAQAGMRVVRSTEPLASWLEQAPGRRLPSPGKGVD